MKPLFQESQINKLKDIIDEVLNLDNSHASILAVISDIETSLKQNDKRKETKILLYFSFIIVLVLSVILIYVTTATWPFVFIIISIGGYAYYKVHEIHLIIELLNKKRKIDPSNPSYKIEYLKCAIDLKIGRKEMLALYLSVTISSIVMRKI